MKERVKTEFKVVEPPSVRIARITSNHRVEFEFSREMFFSEETRNRLMPKKSTASQTNSTQSADGVDTVTRDSVASDVDDAVNDSTNTDGADDDVRTRRSLTEASEA